MKPADQIVTQKFKIQDSQYQFPYHHLVSFPDFNNGKIMMSGIEYFGYLKKVLEIAKQQKFQSLLDIGCGDGKMIFELAKIFPNKKLVGIDLSEHAILFAKAFNYNNKAVFELKDVRDVKESFDLITLIETLEHIPNDEIPNILENIDRLLNKGGTVLVSVPAQTIPVQSKHYRHYTLDMLKNYFKNYQLEESYFMVKKGFLHKVMVYITYKFSSIKIIRSLSGIFANNFLFRAGENSGRHVVALFRKN